MTDSAKHRNTMDGAWRLYDAERAARERSEHNLASLQQAFEEMKTLAAQRLAALQDAERQRDELLKVATAFIFEWDNCRSSGEWPIIQLSELRAAVAAARKEK